MPIGVMFHSEFVSPLLLGTQGIQGTQGRGLGRGGLLWCSTELYLRFNGSDDAQHLPTFFAHVLLIRRCCHIRSTR